MLLPKPIWKDIEGYEGKYQVSNIGQVRSLNYHMTGKAKRLKPGIDRGGYNYVNLYKNGKYKHYLVHRLVAQAFIPNPDNLPEVNHLSEVKSDNRVENLEWCDRKYNNSYGARNEKAGKAMIGKNLSENNGRSRKVKCIELNIIFDCIADANEYLDKDRQNPNICMCLIGKSKTAWKMHWEYVNEYI